MIETNVIHCGECAETMAAHLPDNSIDLTISSPPYDNLREYKGFTFDFPKIAGQLWRVTKPGGVVVWVVADATIKGSETGTSFKQALGFMELGFRLHDTMIFEKINPAPQLKHTKRYTQAFEYMFVFSKAAPTNCNYICVSTTTIRNSRTSFGTRNPNGDVARKNHSYRQPKKIDKNIWRYNIGYGQATKDKVAHKCSAIFPEALARDHIISWSNPGDIVLDPMCGSGTVPKMCVEQGRKYVAIDISPEYVELTRQRVAGGRVPLPGMVAEAGEVEQLGFDNLSDS